MQSGEWSDMPHSPDTFFRRKDEDKRAYTALGGDSSDCGCGNRARADQLWSPY